MFEEANIQISDNHGSYWNI